MNYISVLDDIDGSKSKPKPLPTLTPVTIIDSNGNTKIIYIQVG